MDNSGLAFPRFSKPGLIMVFVDGENLAIQYGMMLNDRDHRLRHGHVSYEKDALARSKYLNFQGRGSGKGEIIRRHYYVAIQGDDSARQKLRESLKVVGIESPRVFRKDKTRGSKQVDISLAAEMLSHAFRRNYDTAVLVAGDEDYVPLVNAVKAEGRRVIVWFFKEKCSKILRNEADHFFDIGSILFNASPERGRFWE